MILYFKNRLGQLRRIGKIDGRMSAKKIADEIFSQIRSFCDERHFKIFYTRVWNEDWNGRPMTKFDVGSHSEFFYTYPQSHDLIVKAAMEQNQAGKETIEEASE